MDIGAHKGYFALWALSHGASGVISYEPQSQNFEYLELNRRHHTRQQDWIIRRALVGQAKDRARLFLSKESWGHSVFSDIAGSDNYEEVDVEPLAALLSLAEEKWPNRRIVMKVNVEGAAEDVIMSASAMDYKNVSSIHFDVEPGSPYESSELLAFLDRVGFGAVSVTQSRYFCVERLGPR